MLFTASMDRTLIGHDSHFMAAPRLSVNESHPASLVARLANDQIAVAMLPPSSVGSHDFRAPNHAQGTIRADAHRFNLVAAALIGHTSDGYRTRAVA
jgi:hypothetical protein